MKNHSFTLPIEGDAPWLQGYIGANLIFSYACLASPTQGDAMGKVHITPTACLSSR